MSQKTIAFFPEAAFGPALNSVGIAQASEKLGHKAVFLSDPGFLDVYKGYGFEAHPVNMSEPMPPEEMAKFWEDFINGHIPNFNKTPYEQVDNYVRDCWEAIVDTSEWAEKDLPGVLADVEPRHHLRRQRDPVSRHQALCGETANPGCASSRARKTRSRIPTSRRICPAAASTTTPASAFATRSTRSSSRSTTSSTRSLRARRSALSARPVL